MKASDYWIIFALNYVVLNQLAKQPFVSLFLSALLLVAVYFVQRYFTSFLGYFFGLIISGLSVTAIVYLGSKNALDAHMLLLAEGIFVSPFRRRLDKKPD